MDRDRSPKRGRSGTRVQARCAWCGEVELEPQGLRVNVGSGGTALFEFVCPSCGRLNLGGIDGAEAPALFAAGAEWCRGPAPFELLEERSGPPIGWDDLLDFHQALAQHDLWDWFRAAPGLRRPEGRERDAA